MSNVEPDEYVKCTLQYLRSSKEKNGAHVGEEEGRKGRNGKGVECLSWVYTTSSQIIVTVFERSEFCHVYL